MFGFDALNKKWREWVYTDILPENTFSQLYLSVSQGPCDSETNQITKSYCHLTSMIIPSDAEVVQND
jgi:hypothetical protein